MKRPTAQEHVEEALDLAAAELHMEADRFQAKAKDLALSVLQSPEQPDKVRLAKEHLIRSETYRAAATLVAAHPKPEPSSQTKAGKLC